MPVGLFLYICYKPKEKEESETLLLVGFVGHAKVCLNLPRITRYCLSLSHGFSGVEVSQKLNFRAFYYFEILKYLLYGKYVMLCAVGNHLYNFKNVKNRRGGLKPEACNFTKSNTPSCLQFY